MKKLKLSIYSLSILVLSFAASCNDENIISAEDPLSRSAINKKTTGEREIDDLANKPDGNNIPYPNIIHHIFIPNHEFFGDRKCRYWRIEWPEYNASVPTDEVPGVFSTNNGALNSFYYLNNVHPTNTYNAQMSLYKDNKIQIMWYMWEDLKYVNSSTNHLFDDIHFSKYDIDENKIEDWVTKRPDLFEIYWGYYANPLEKLEYEEGDFILFKNSDKNLFGGIRIVSMNPRIIEVYLAEPI